MITNFLTWLEAKIAPDTFSPQKVPTDKGNRLLPSRYIQLQKNGEITKGFDDKNPTMQIQPNAKSISTRNLQPQSRQFRTLAKSVQDKYGKDADNWDVQIYGASHNQTGNKNYYRSLKYWMNQPSIDFSKGLPEFLYHGTSTNLWNDGIKQKGLMPRRLTGSSGSYGNQGDSISLIDNVYLSIHPDAATRLAAEKASQQHGGNPLVLKIKTEGLFPEKFTPDEDSFEDSAVKSADKIGTVGYRGRIPFTNIQPFLMATKSDPKSWKYDKWGAYTETPLEDHPMLKKLKLGESLSSYDSPTLIWSLLDAGVVEKDSYNYKVVKQIDNDTLRKIIKESPWASICNDISRDLNDWGNKGLKSLDYHKSTSSNPAHQTIIDMLVSSGIYYGEREYLTRSHSPDPHKIIKLAKSMHEKGLDYRELVKILKDMTNQS